MDLTDYFTKHLKYTLDSAIQGSSSETDHILEHKTNFNTFLKTEIMPCIKFKSVAKEALVTTQSHRA